MSYERCEPGFSIDRHIIKFMQTNTFYAELSRWIYKFPTEQVKTAAVCYHKETDDIALCWNPKFIASLTDDQIMGVLKHEFNHIVFGHLTSRRRKPADVWNYGTDAAINSLLVEEDGAKCLPEWCIIPGQPQKSHLDGSVSTDPVSTAIASFPKLQSSEWYFTEIMKVVEKNGGGGKGKCDGSCKPGGTGEPCDGSCGKGGGPDTLDDHDGWDTVPEDMKEYVEHKTRQMVEKAVNAADQSSNGWGNIPANIREEIRKSVSRLVPWRSVLKQFIGSLLPGDRTSSIKRINRRYPYIHPGVKRGRVAKLLICVDQSGSVSNEMLGVFFAELAVLSKKVDIDILPFDSAADAKDIYVWKKGTLPKTKRSKCGGTDFDAPNKVVNDPRNRGRWDACMIFSDGECSKPGASKIKRGWVIAQNRKLNFATNELVIHLDDVKPTNKGAWR